MRLSETLFLVGVFLIFFVGTRIIYDKISSIKVKKK